MKTMQNPAGFRTVFTGSTGINLKQQNRTDHLLQKPDIFICYGQAIIVAWGREVGKSGDLEIARFLNFQFRNLKLDDPTNALLSDCSCLNFGIGNSGIVRFRDRPISRSPIA
jgi:hypothetical protein